jgi:hypothetical protein
VLNYDKWCTVTINGGTAFNGASGTATVAAGSTATIVATPNAHFAIGDGGGSNGPWFGINQNDGGLAAGTIAGSGATETTTGTVTIGAGPTQCVSVCCEFSTGGGCPTTNPCP